MCRQQVLLFIAAMGVGLLSSLFAERPLTGARLFDGRDALGARLAGHTLAMPSQATTCLNCHHGAQPIGPPLSAASLKLTRPRRGGPPSRYDESSFCKVLRTGVDPAFVVLNQEMPHYQITAEQCASLWRFLTHAK